MSDAIRILMIVTSQATMGVGGAPTGVWFEELATPYYAFVDADVEVDIAAVAGGRIPIDPHSLQAVGGNGTGAACAIEREDVRIQRDASPDHFTTPRYFRAQSVLRATGHDNLRTARR